MSFSRREILRAIALGGGLIAGELWIPGARLIFIPTSELIFTPVRAFRWQSNGSIMMLDMVMRNIDTELGTSELRAGTLSVSMSSDEALQTAADFKIGR